MSPKPHSVVRGAQLFDGLISHQAQHDLVDTIRSSVQNTPFFRPETRRGQKMSVLITSFGNLGWISDRRGYRYQSHHPNGNKWPTIPNVLTDLWHLVLPQSRPPDTCLVNYYSEQAKMGLHQDSDEADLTHPILSVSLGDDARFRIGNATRGGSTKALWLRSGDVIVMGGPARVLFHGVDHIVFGSSSLLPKGGRINLTLRVAGP